jgi:type VI protein secretion system component VasF
MSRTSRTFAPWAVFAALLVVGVVAYFTYADRVPSLLQALADR